MKVKKNRQIEKATRIFTDREEPRASFWKKYDEVKKEKQGEENIHVLVYYGIGGIGKSSLLKKLICEMHEKISEPEYVYFDFNNSCDSRSVLSRLAIYMTENFKYTFPLFDLASYIYAKKAGEKVDSAEVKSLSERSPLLNIALKIVDAFTGSIVTKLFEIGDESFAYFKNRLNKHRQDVMRMEYIDADELYKNLPYYFSLDMTHNLKNADNPLVIFLDTYEKVVNELSSIGEPLNADLWIRGENGIIQNIPGVLWVIAGREKLKWERFDSEWSSALEQHILGNLSFSDSNFFLENAGIDDKILIEKLYSLTKGTPVYLDLCVDRFMSIKENGKKPDISMFGTNTLELIERFVRYMGDSVKDMVYMLSCIQRWDDELISLLAPQILPSFSITAYEKTKEISFISESVDGVFSIHQTVGDVLRNDCSGILKKRVANVLIDTFKDSVKKKDFYSEDYAVRLSYLLHGGLLLDGGRSEILKFYKVNVQNLLQGLVDAGLFDKAYSVFDVFFEYAEQKKDDALYVVALRDKAFCFNEEGKVAEGKKLLEASLELAEKNLGDNDPETLIAMQNYAQLLKEFGKYKECLELYEKILKKTIEVRGAKHLTILKIKSLIVEALSLNCLYENALELSEKVFIESKAIYGEKNSFTVLNKLDYAKRLSDVGQQKEALEIYDNVYEIIPEICEKNEFYTLSCIDLLSCGFAKCGKYEKSFELNNLLLRKSIELHGENHPETMFIMNEIIKTLRKLGKKEEALEKMETLVQKSIDVFGVNHPDAILYMNNFASILKEFGKYKEALKINEAVFLKNKELLGENHPDTIVCMYNLSGTFYNLERYEEALKLLESVVQKSKETLGVNHPDTLLYTNVLSKISKKVYFKKNRTAKNRAVRFFLRFVTTLIRG